MYQLCKRNSIDHAHNQRMRLPGGAQPAFQLPLRPKCIMGYTREIGQHPTRSPQNKQNNIYVSIGASHNSNIPKY